MKDNTNKAETEARAWIENILQNGIPLPDDDITDEELEELAKWAAAYTARLYRKLAARIANN